MNSITKRVLLDTLRHIRDVGAPVRNEGICVNVSRLTRDLLKTNYHLHKALDSLIDEWPNKYSSWGYPVGGVAEYNRELINGTIWCNPRRIELLNWLITQLENE